MTFEKTADQEAALKDADFVINTATVTHNEYFMQRRRNMTAKLGYFYDRTGMPEYHNLQLMLNVAKDMEKLCPDAWILLAGNPVFDGTTLMTRETGIKVCGLCHGHYGYTGVARTLGLDPDQVTWQAPGLNHNIWLTDFIYENKDMYPKLDQWIAEESEAYWERMTREGKAIPTQMSRAAIHQYKLYGLMPIGDTPRRGGWWYHTDLATRQYWYDPNGGKDTPAGRDAVLAGKAKKYEQMKAAAYDEKIRPIDLFGAQVTSRAAHSHYEWIGQQRGRSVSGQCTQLRARCRAFPTTWRWKSPRLSIRRAFSLCACHHCPRKLCWSASIPTGSRWSAPSKQSCRAINQ